MAATAIVAPPSRYLPYHLLAGGSPYLHPSPSQVLRPHWSEFAHLLDLLLPEQALQPSSGRELWVVRDPSYHPLVHPANTLARRRRHGEVPKVGPELRMRNPHLVVLGVHPLVQRGGLRRVEIVGIVDGFGPEPVAEGHQGMQRRFHRSRLRVREQTRPRGVIRC